MSNPKWKEAMLSKYDIMKCAMWELVERRTKKKLIGTKWVSKTTNKVHG